MKPTSNFRMKKQTKRIASTILDSHERGRYKKAMIHSQLAEEESRRQPLSRKDKE